MSRNTFLPKLGRTFADAFSWAAFTPPSSFCPSKVNIMHERSTYTFVPSRFSIPCRRPRSLRFLFVARPPAPWSVKQVRAMHAFYYAPLPLPALLDLRSSPLVRSLRLRSTPPYERSWAIEPVSNLPRTSYPPRSRTPVVAEGVRPIRWPIADHPDQRKEHRHPTLLA